MNTHEKVILASGVVAVIAALSLLTVHLLGKSTISGGGIIHLVIGLIIGLGLLLRGVAAWRAARETQPPHQKSD
jgi:hypothetical protein